MDGDLNVVVSCVKENRLVEESVVFLVRVPTNWEEVSAQEGKQREV